jgi:hypothetical protein
MDQEHVRSTVTFTGDRLTTGRLRHGFPGLYARAHREAAVLFLALVLLLGTAVPSPAGVLATGGTESVINVGGTSYRVHTFTDSGTFTVNAPSGLDVEYLIVAGGGGGGNCEQATITPGGGGGAGGLLQGTQSNVTAVDHAVTVGQGGLAAPSSTVGYGGTGGDSSVFSRMAKGGGGGGGYAPNSEGKPGGSGGGGSGLCSNNPQAGGTSTSGQGNDGGAGECGAASGGGGAGSPGVNAPAKEANGSAGDGLSLPITGSAVTYATGGEPGSRVSGYKGENGEDGLGEGGQGSGWGTGAEAGDGGDGIVILRYAEEAFITVTGSPAITIQAPTDAGDGPDQVVADGDARLQWASIDNNSIQVKRDASSSLPSGVRLYVTAGSDPRQEVTGTWATITTSADACGDVSLAYSVDYDPVADLAATEAVSVTVEYQITAN